MTIKNVLAVSALAILTLSATTVSANARPNRVSVERIADRDAGAVRGSTTYQTRRGQAVRTIDRNYNADAGTGLRTRTYTGANGATAAEVRQYERTEKGYEASTTYTDFQGRTASRSASAEVAEGTVVRTRGATYRNGESADVTATATRTEDGYVRSRAFETSTGRGGALSIEGQHTENGGAINKVVANAAGETVGTKSTVLTNSDDNVSRTTVVTNANGEEIAVYSRTIDKD